MRRDYESRRVGDLAARWVADQLTPSDLRGSALLRKYAPICVLR
jgi:hypothetical protein